MPLLERIGDVSVWWFPRNFCQSRYGEYRDTGSNSCTLISLLIADAVAKAMSNERTFYRGHEHLPQRATELFGNAINDGNAVYSREYCPDGPGGSGSAGNDDDDDADDSPMRRIRSSTYSRGSSMRTSMDVAAAAIGGSTAHAATNASHNRPSTSQGNCNQNLSIPDAIAALQRSRTLNFQLRERFFTHLPADRTNAEYASATANGLTQIFSVGVELFRPPPHSTSTLPSFVFAAVIADSRTVVFMFEFPANIIYLFDSHQHGKRFGALVAQTPLDNLGDMMQWFVRMIHDVYRSRPTIFEVSFLTPGVSGTATKTTQAQNYRRWSLAREKFH